MPTINDVPIELMVEILLHLSHKDLTRVMRTSKLMEVITHHHAFDKIFFRSTPAPNIDLKNLEINPVFDMLSYTSRSKIDDVTFLFCDDQPDGSTNYRNIPLTRTSAAAQNATEPAATRIIIRPYPSSYGGFTIKSKQGITVLDVMEGLCEYYDEPHAPYDACHIFFEGFHKDENSTAEKIILGGWWGS